MATVKRCISIACLALFAACGSNNSSDNSNTGTTGGSGTTTVPVAQKPARWVDASDNIYIVESSEHAIRFVPSQSGNFFGTAMRAGNIYTIAGNRGVQGFGGDGNLATDANLAWPAALALDKSGNVYITDQSNARVRMVPQVSGTYFGTPMTAANIYTIAGNGNFANSGDGNTALQASFEAVQGIAVDANGNVFVSDVEANTVRAIAAQTTTLFGVQIEAGSINTVVGPGSPVLGEDGNPATLNLPLGIALDVNGNLFIADASNHAVRRVDAQTPVVTTVAGSTADGNVATKTEIYPTDAFVDSTGNLFVTDAENAQVLFVPATSGTYLGNAVIAGEGYVIVGDPNGGKSGFSGDGNVATQARISSAMSVTLDSNGNVYIADTYNDRIRKVDGNSGVISTIAGNGNAPSVGDTNEHVATDTGLGEPFLCEWINEQ